jgi:RsiW-degrading membrane proteinase PrsW (M82 family)
VYFTKCGYIAIYGSSRRELSVALTPTLIWVGILQTVLYLLFIRAIDLYEREPLRYIVPVFIWGFAVATTISLIFNTLASITLSSVVSQQAANFVTAVFVAPVVEESSKGLALFLVFGISYIATRRRGLVEFAGVMDGIVYGSAVGFGFAIAEDILYGAQFGAETFIVRRIFGGFGHAAFTSLTGIGIGLMPWVRYRAVSWVPPLLGLLGAILLHAIFNFTATVFGVLAYVVLFFVVLLYLVIIIIWLSVERRVIREELRDDVAEGLVTPEEHAIVSSYFRRTGYYLRLIFSGNLGEWSRARKIHSTAVDLALAERLARRAPSPHREDRVRALRHKLRLLKSGAALRSGPAPRTSP